MVFNWRSVRDVRDYDFMNEEISRLKVLLSGIELIKSSSCTLLNNSCGLHYDSLHVWYICWHVVLAARIKVQLRP